MKKRPVLSSILWAIIILLFYVLAGVITQVIGMNDIQTKFTQGICIWLSVILAIQYMKKSKVGFNSFGLKLPDSDSYKKVLFYLPAIIIELSVLLMGFPDNNILYIITILFMTLAVAFAEEIYFRGIIITILKELSIKKSIIISSIIFGLTHAGNIMGGSDIFLTLLQIIISFAFGIVFAEIFIITKSLFPTIVWHFIHNLFVYVGVQLDVKTNIIYAIFQIIILIIYAIFLLKKLPKI